MDAPEPTLQNLLDQQELKWIFVGGKGGVGKTTCSSSLAVQLAAVRESVLIISTDPAHNLSDAFRQKFTKVPTLVEGFTNLYAMEVDPTPDTGDFEAEWMNDGFLTDLVGSIPGIDEAMSFAEVMKQVQTLSHDVIVFDTAPTGHTLRLLNFPSLLEKGLAKVMSLRGTLSSVMGPLSRFMGGAAGEENLPDQLLSRMEGMLEVVRKVNAQFKEPTMTTFVCVCIPEFLSLYETERLVQELAKFDMDTHNIIINQVIFPEAAAGSRLLQARVRMQSKYLEQFYELYEDFHIVKLPLLEEEVRGPDSLRAFGKHLVTEYSPPPSASGALEEQLVAEVERLRARVLQLEVQVRQLGAEPVAPA